ncbi:MAG: TetR/AcrR family transcriptional regulator [Acidimicrobiales bacterium]
MSVSYDDSVSTSSLRMRNKRRTRDRIYEAAINLFAERPYAEVTIEEICQLADVGRATFFRFYGTKAGLLTEFNDRIIDRLEKRIEMIADGSPTDQLWAVQDEITTAWGLTSPATREMAREWIRNATAAELSEGGSTPELVALVADVVRGGQRSGEFTDRHEADFIAWMIVSALSATTADWLGAGDDDAFVHGAHDVISFMLDGLRRADQ